MAKSIDKTELFARTPVPKALRTMAIPTIVSQLINLVYNVVDTFFIGRTGNSFMVAATTIAFTLVMMMTALSNLFGIGGGSHVARLMGAGHSEKAKSVSSFCLYASILMALAYSALIGLFLEPLLKFFGASDQTLGFAKSYTVIVIVIGALPGILSLVLAHLLRNTGYSGKASIGLSGGGLLNVALDPLFMFVIMPKGQEVTGAALATLISNICACAYLLAAYARASRKSPLSINPADARQADRENIRKVISVGVPSAILPGLFDVANICLNILAAGHSDLVLAAMGIVMKAERIPNAINIGICQGMLPIVAFNLTSGDHARMKETLDTARRAGLAIAFTCIVLFELLAGRISGVFLSTAGGNAESAVRTLAYAALFLRIRCLASPVQFMNYYSSFSLQALGDGRRTMILSIVRELVIYIPFMFILNIPFGEIGLAASLPAGEACSAVFAFRLLSKALRERRKD
ncbi:MAG: MATE family efflux transporter [Firmicutes bacterium]|nr:MATE family efflux transporter [Bacillota bacterium]